MMHATRLTPTHEQTLIDNVPERRWETTYATVSWDYPPSPVACYDALLARGASHSRFLRIAYLSARERVNPALPSTSYPVLTPFLPGTTRRPGVRVPPMSPVSVPPALPLPCPLAPAHPAPHALKRRKLQWSKPPHYHAALLRAPLSRRKGHFRGILQPAQAVDFFRWDVLLGVRAGVGVSPAPCWKRGEGASLLVVESVLEPYEAAAGFFGWHGLGEGVVRRMERGGDGDGDVDGECCWDGCRVDLQLEVDEAVVEEGRARWARTAEELVGPPGVVLQWVVEDGAAHKVVASSSMSSICEPVRWDPDIDAGPSRPPKSSSAPGEKRQSSSFSVAPPPGSSPGSKLEPKTDSPSAWWNGPSPHRRLPAAPRVPSFRFPPPPSVQYAPPQLQFSPWFPPGRVPSVQGHGYWYGAQPAGTPSVNRDPNLPTSLVPHSHVFASPITPTSTHPSQSPRYPITPTLGRDEYGPGHECDKETEIDHGYESTTTTTDSDPPPHTPIGATTSSHCVEALRVHGDEEAHADAIDGVLVEHVDVEVGLSGPATPVKRLGRCGSDRDDDGSAKTTVVFPSLNGSFRQGILAQTHLSGWGVSMQATPVSPLSPTSVKSNANAKESSPEWIGPGSCCVSADGPAGMPSLCAPPTSPSPGLRRDAQGFWEPMERGMPSPSPTPSPSSSPSSSSSSPSPSLSLSSSSLPSLPLSPSESKTRSRPAGGWIGEEIGKNGTETLFMSGGHSPAELMEGAQGTFGGKSRSLSPGPRRVASACSRPASASIPASVSAFGGSYPSSPSLVGRSSVVAPNPNLHSNPNPNLNLNPTPNASSSETTLLPAFLATAGGAKRKKTSRTREIVDRLRSSSVDAGEPLSGVESSSVTVGGGQRAASPSSRLESDVGKSHGQAPSLKSADSGSSGSGSIITPFPILSVSQSSASSFSTANHQGTAGTIAREPIVATISRNAAVATSPTTLGPGPQLMPSTPNGGTSPSTHHPPHPLPSPSHPAAHPQPPLGPPPAVLAVPAYPHSMYVPFTQYHLAPPHPGQPAQGTWLAVYPGRPAHLPVHPLSPQTHVQPITGMSGMRHVSW